MPAAPFRRRPGGLLWYWALGLALAGLIYGIVHTIPAFADLLAPVYWLIGIALVALTARWFRPRAAERRHGERRESDRRDHEEEPPPAA